MPTTGPAEGFRSFSRNAVAVSTVAGTDLYLLHTSPRSRPGPFYVEPSPRSRLLLTCPATSLKAWSGRLGRSRSRRPHWHARPALPRAGSPTRKQQKPPVMTRSAGSGPKYLMSPFPSACCRRSGSARATHRQLRIGITGASVVMPKKASPSSPSPTSRWRPSSLLTAGP
jgi:hypothetical protein